MSDFRRLVRLGLIAFGVSAGCQVLIGIDDVVPEQGAGAPCSMNGTRDGSETGVDCGGPACPSCPVNQGCLVGPDCESKVCIGGNCAAPSCTDQFKNGDEVDSDCGGACPTCGPGAQCASDGDCTSNACTDGFCMSTCDDGVKGGSETDADCGGTECPACPDESACIEALDCESGVCLSGACESYHVWSKRFGGMDRDLPKSLAVDSNGSTILAGIFEGTADLGSGPMDSAGHFDIVVAKYDPAGAVSWTKRFGDDLEQSQVDAAVDATGDILLTGSFYGTLDFGGSPVTSAGIRDVFVTKLSLQGNHLWTKRFGSANAEDAYGVATDAQRNIIVAGSFGGATDFGGGTLASAGGNDIFLLKLSPTGNHIWSKRFGGPNNQRPWAVAVDPAGGSVTVGSFSGTVDFGGGMLVTATSTNIDGFVAAFDASGVHRWSKAIGSPQGAQFVTAVAIDPAGNVLLAGTFTGTIELGAEVHTSGAADDIFIAKISPSGEVIWSKAFGSASHERDPRLAVDADGSVLMAFVGMGIIDMGGGPLESADAEDAFVVKLDASGNHLWSRRFGGLGTDTLAAAAVFGTEEVLVSGQFTYTIDLGGQILEGQGEGDIFLAKLRLPSAKP